jgi:hypothetical protein
LIVDLDDMSIMDVDKEGKILLERDYVSGGLRRVLVFFGVLLEFGVLVLGPVG